MLVQYRVEPMGERSIMPMERYCLVSGPELGAVGSCGWIGVPASE